MKLPAAGYRDYSSALLLEQGSNISLWSSSPSGVYANGLGFTSTNVYPATTSSRAYGMAVRCMKPLDACSASTPCGTACTFGGLLYDSVTVGTQCWMDRNLGATQVATSSLDYLSYGSLYQWGRATDGHQLITCTGPYTADCSAVNGTTITNSNDPANALFITESNTPWDWRVDQDGTLWNSPGYVNNPCPSGWHVPSGGTTGEWDTAMDTLSLTTCSSDCLNAVANSTLKLPAAGYRYSRFETLYVQGTYGYYWTSTPTVTINSFDSYINSTGVHPSHWDERAFGLSVRCLKD